MVVGRWVKIALGISLVFLMFGCGREKAKTDFELGEGYFLASEYTQSMIRLESWVKKKKNPDIPEAHAMLAVIYHDMDNRKAEYEKEISILKGYGDEGMGAVVKLVENPTIASRLQENIDDILVRGGSSSVGPLITALKNPNWRLKVHAHQALIKVGQPAIPALTTALNASDSYTKSMAIDALCRINAKDAEPMIQQKLNDPDKLVKVSAAVALCAIGKTDFADIIVDGLKDPNVDVRRIAAKAMAEIVNDPPADKMIALIKDPDPDVRNYATIALGKIKSEGAVSMLVKEMRDDKDAQVRSSAGNALEAIGAPSVEPLISLLKSTNDMELIIRVAQILGNIGDKRAVEPMESAYKREKRDMVKNEIAKALNKID
jgi:HEAT repeat protein